jgi:hypothetical protein
MSFVLNMAASVVASLLVIMVAGVLSRTARSLLVTLLGRLLDIDVEVVFRNPREAAPDVRRELDRARRIDLLTGRGGELQRETFTDVLGQAPARRQRQFRILLPQPVPNGAVDWTADREAEVAAFDKAFGNGVLREQIRMTARFLGPFVDAGSVELRFFDYPHIGRILVTDRAAYFTPYSMDAHARVSRVIKYRCGGDMHDHLSRLFEKLWQAAVPAGGETPVPQVVDR